MQISFIILFMIDIYKDNHGLLPNFIVVFLSSSLQNNQACGAIQALKRLYFFFSVGGKGERWTGADLEKRVGSKFKETQICTTFQLNVYSVSLYMLSLSLVPNPSLNDPVDEGFRKCWKPEVPIAPN